MKKKNRGFTIIELIIVVIILAAFLVIGVLGFGVYGGVITGNAWFNDATALTAVKRINPDAVAIVDYDRNIWALSQVTAKDTSGTLTVYDLNTNVAWDAKATTPTVD